MPNLEVTPKAVKSRFVTFGTRIAAQAALNLVNLRAKLPPNLQVVEIIELEDGSFGLAVLEGLTQDIESALGKSAKNPRTSLPGIS